MLNATPLIHVAVGVIVNDQQQILISQRHAQQHLGHLWEFPGGKLEADESAPQALARELKEELDIDAKQSRPLIEFVHHYAQHSVHLHVFIVTDWFGQPQSHEQQPLRWVSPQQLRDYALPAANKSILQALRLPSLYAISDEPQQVSLTDYVNNLLQRIQQQQLSLLQLRAHTLSLDDYHQAAALLIPAAHQQQCQIILQSDLATACALNADGIHLNHQRLWQAKPFADDGDMIISAACHSPQDLQQALNVNTTCALVSPIKPTPSHADAIPIGWQTFKQWIGEVPLPVYALGGLTRHDLPTAQQYGAQGIAGIRGFAR
jgi:8-oxo-dGTP diphosphatase